jgi:oxygen-independent coproporphyrinogen-3 oxidase
MQIRSENRPTAESHSLYLHIPFCRHRCSYCDFNTYTTLGDLQLPYIESLCQELKQVGAAGENRGKRIPVHTLYIGGGTPSIIPSKQLRRVLKHVERCFNLDGDAEISLEANPGTVDAQSLSVLAELRVNRISLGVQSAIPAELELLDREHDFEAVGQAVMLSRAAGFTDLNLDLIYGVPGQTLSSWQQSLSAVLRLTPTHLSLYCLTIETGTPMKRWLDSGRVNAPDPDLAAEQYGVACDMLADHGYKHYEISNWALPGHECRHNLTYWRNRSYLGLGAGAHGHVRGFRYHVVQRPRIYIRRMQNKQPTDFPFSSAMASKHRVGRAEGMSDTVITQLRLVEEGLDLEEFEKKFGQTLDDAYGGLVSRLTEWGLLMQDGRSLRLTKKGLFLSNQVFYRFLE